MKKIIYLLFVALLLVFTTCKKRDEKLQKLIIGTWEVKPKDMIFYVDYPDLISTKYTFNEDGTVIEQDCNSRGDWTLLPGGGCLQLTENILAPLNTK